MPKVIPCPILYLIVTNFTCIDGCGDTDDIDNNSPSNISGPSESLGVEAPDSANTNVAEPSALPVNQENATPSKPNVGPTSVATTDQTDAQQLAEQHQLIHEILPDSSLTVQELTYARALYNSRRYPLRFALADTDEEDNYNKKRKRTMYYYYTF